LLPNVDDTRESVLDDRLEWRRLFSEAWGTFLLVLVAAGAGVVGALQPAGAGLSLPAKVVAPGIMVMASIYFMGTVSGAHRSRRRSLVGAPTPAAAFQCPAVAPCFQTSFRPM
jgi:Major intrinsic protein